MTGEYGISFDTAFAHHVCQCATEGRWLVQVCRPTVIVTATGEGNE